MFARLAPHVPHRVLFLLTIPLVVSTLVVNAAPLTAGVQIPARDPRLDNGVLASLARRPLVFEENRGQTDRRVRYLARAGGARLFFTDREVVWSLSPACPPDDSLVPSPLPVSPGPCAERGDWTVSMAVAGARRRTPIAEDPRPAVVHYLTAAVNRDGAHHLAAPTFGRLRQRDLLPGVDVLYYGRVGTLEFDLVIHPQSDPGAVQLELRGASDLFVDGEGNLVLSHDRRSLVYRAPVIYQEKDGERISVDGNWQILGAELVGFRVGEYDHELPLVIDPVVLFSTHLGSASEDQIRDVAVDRNGNVYVTGFTRALDFPLTDPLQASLAGGSTDAFVTKLASDGTDLVFSTYFGGSGADVGTGIALDGSDAVVALTTSSLDLPVTSAIQPSYGGGRFDCAVVKIGHDGSHLDFSTYLGGHGYDFSSLVQVDHDGSIVITGASASTDFPLADPVQPSNAGDFDVVLSRIDPAGDRLLLSTYLGGSSLDQAFGLALDSSGRAVVVGATQSVDFPTRHALQPAPGGALDGIVAVFDAHGLSSSTYFGGSGLDLLSDVAVSGGAFVTGWTSSPDLPVASALQPALGGGFDAFVARLNSIAATPGLQFSTYVGGAGEDLGLAIDVRGSRILVAGRTSSAGFPTAAPLQGYGGDPFDVVLFEMATNGAAIPFSTFLGGAGADQLAHAAVIDRLHNAIVAGWTASTDFPTTPGVLQPMSAGGDDGFVVKIAVASCAEKLALVGDRIEELKHSGGIPRSAGLLLLGKLQLARFFLDRQRPEKSRFFLEHLLRDLSTHPLLRRLSAEVHEEIASAVEEILAQLEIETST